MLTGGKLSGSLAKKVIQEMFVSGKSASEIAKEQGLEVVADEDRLGEIAGKVIADNQKVVKDIAKNPNALKFLIGQMMKETKGMASPAASEKILRNKLGL
jgi:aspartyl-tRNA(Asn)/glutamyl-tRNA(Gln) amidotransferase subunit B